MSRTFAQVRELIQQNKLRFSDHAHDEMLNDGLLGQDILVGIADAVVVEDYPAYGKGPCVLLLQRDTSNSPLHVLWGIPVVASEPAVVITVYRPNPDLWMSDNLRRR